MKILTMEKVRFAETDMMGVVHHANYLQWMENGRVEYLHQVGIGLCELMDAGVLFPIVDVECKYHSSARLGDKIVVETSLLTVTKVKLEFTYKIYKDDADNGVLLASGRTRNVFINEKGTVCRLPQEYLSRLKGES